MNNQAFTHFSDVTIYYMHALIEKLDVFWKNYKDYRGDGLPTLYFIHMASYL